MTPSRAKGALTIVLLLVVFAAHNLPHYLLFDPAEGDDRSDAAARAARAAATGPRRTLSSSHRRPEAEGAASGLRRTLASKFIGYRAGEDDSSYDFSVVLISYHKTGHDLQMDLVDYLKYEFPGVGPRLTEYGNKSPLRRRRHPPTTPCARIHLQTGSVMVQHAPDLFCDPADLARILLFGGDGHTEGDKGVKVVHLVRNPFEMAVSNYHYHARVPTPEAWVKYQNPCDIEYDEEEITDNFSDMVVPTLKKTKYASLNVEFEAPLFTRLDFAAIVDDCKSLYQTKEKLKGKSFLDHLMNYDAPEGLRLATAEMMIQGYDNGGDILRMANNIVKLKQAQMKVRQNPGFKDDNNKPKRELQVYTMSLDDFIERPAEAAYRFFDFVMDSEEGPTRVSRMQKEAVAQQYERYYEEKMRGSRHVTHGKSKNTGELKDYLRHDPVFGKPLGRIEVLVDTALKASRGDESESDAGR